MSFIEVILLKKSMLIHSEKETNFGIEEVVSQVKNYGFRNNKYYQHIETKNNTNQEQQNHCHSSKNSNNNKKRYFINKITYESRHDNLPFYHVILGLFVSIVWWVIIILVHKNFGYNKEFSVLVICFVWWCLWTLIAEWGTYLNKELWKIMDPIISISLILPFLVPIYNMFLNIQLSIIDRVSDLFVAELTYMASFFFASRGARSFPDYLFWTLFMFIIYIALNYTEIIATKIFLQ